MTVCKKAFAILAVMLAIAISVPAEADTFTLSNDNGGDGFVNTFSGSFDLFGSNNGSINSPLPNTTTYSATAVTNQTLTVSWAYHTDDAGVPGIGPPPFFDPAGYVLNGVRTQLSDDFGAVDQSGSFIATLLAGDVYGFFVSSSDSCCGRADITVIASDTPLPAALPLLGAGLAGLGLLGWRQKRTAVQSKIFALPLSANFNGC